MTGSRVGMIQHNAVPPDTEPPGEGPTDVLSDAVADQIALFRKARGWNTERLAEECAKIGMADLTAAVLRNIESGRRNNEGIRRRTVSVDELIGLALALKVPPQFLLVPYPNQESVDLTPTWPMSIWMFHTWALGRVGMLDSEDPSTQDADDNFLIQLKRTRHAFNQLERFNDAVVQRKRIAAKLHGFYRRMNAEKATAAEIDHVAANVKIGLREAEELDIRIIGLIQQMKLMAFPVPPLPSDLQYLESLSEEEYEDDFSLRLGRDGLGPHRGFTREELEDLEHIFGGKPHERS